MGDKLLLKRKKKRENERAERPSIRLAEFIIHKRHLIESLFAAGCLFSLLAMLFVNVNYDLTEYLPRCV